MDPLTLIDVQWRDPILTQCHHIFYLQIIKKKMKNNNQNCSQLTYYKNFQCSFYTFVITLYGFLRHVFISAHS